MPLDSFVTKKPGARRCRAPSFCKPVVILGGVSDFSFVITYRLSESTLVGYIELCYFVKERSGSKKCSSLPVIFSESVVSTNLKLHFLLNYMI